MYDEDYEAVQPFVKLASDHNVAVVVLHHLNQIVEPHDPFDAFSGSAGPTAAAEGIWLLTRKRGEADAYLMVDGKDIEEPQELALGWDGLTCTWTVQGDANTYRLNKERREVVELVEEEGEPMGPKAVAAALGRNYEATRKMMNRMAEAGELIEAGYGKYDVPRGPSPTSPTSTKGSTRTGRTGRTPPLYEGGEVVALRPDNPSFSVAKGATAPASRDAIVRPENDDARLLGSPGDEGDKRGPLTDEEVERVKRLIREGMKPKLARQQVLAKRNDGGTA